ncbi:MAG: lysophospholipid acyltransferase family protein [Actinomycetota bacterium]
MTHRGDLNGWWRFGLVVVGFVRRLLFTMRVKGAERVPARGPAIVAANHVSMLDGVALALVTGERRWRMTRFLVAAEFFAKPLVAWALRLYRQIPLERGRADTGALDEAVGTIRAGALAGIFPEGTVNPDPESGLQRGRSGVGRIALRSAAPVIPVGIWGTQARWPKTGLHLGRPWRPMVAIAYGEPIEPQGDADSVDDVQVFTDLVMTGIAKQVAEARALATAEGERSGQRRWGDQPRRQR